MAGYRGRPTSTSFPRPEDLSGWQSVIESFVEATIANTWQIEFSSAVWNEWAAM
jgi:hypothetical protein